MEGGSMYAVLDICGLPEKGGQGLGSEMRGP